MVDHLVLFTVKEDARAEDVEDLLASLKELKRGVPNVVDLSVGENFSERSQGYTHGLFVRLRTVDDLRSYISQPELQAVVEKLDTLTKGRLVVDYEYEL